MTLSDFSELRSDAYALDGRRIMEEIGRQLKADRDTTMADRQARAFYRSQERVLWVSRLGVTPQADTLLAFLNSVGDMGFSPERFFVPQITADLDRMKSLDFGEDDINTVAARLDYNLTKAYLRYGAGQRYGFIDPHRVFNRLDHDPHDASHRAFIWLFDVDMETIDKGGYAHMLALVSQDSVPRLLREAQPGGRLYMQLRQKLAETAGQERMKVLVNMERCRWRQRMNPDDYGKRVVVNTAAFTLTAIDGDSVTEMKVVCGSRRTKTPLLNSYIRRMDLNPKWIIPTNIVKSEVAEYAGDSAYFARNNYYIIDKQTWSRVDISEVSPSMLMDGSYRVVQEDGEGNSLGRIAFRFDNNFSIYLHDTPTKSTFGRADRSASHGCVRVEKPFELARFLLRDKDSLTLAKIDYSMKRCKDEPEDSVAAAKRRKEDSKMLLSGLTVEPQIPLFITYQTMFLAPDGRLETCDDPYGYDAVMGRILREYTN